MLPTTSGGDSHHIMQKLRQQNDRLREELRDLTAQLEAYIEKTRIQKQPNYAEL
jgi:hypothetical protein